ncbi:MAG TPA: glycosyltransferase [Chitinophagaceae bacterium]|jgi:glycosyltransferase involved in cell wall biosynthesis|nr:glycosyltransferase [Chitinophagaceae bacterium]
MTPLVSIALCTYNAGDFLAPMLESLLQQTWTHTEIVCCDDKSTDDTVQRLEDFSRRYPGKFRVYVNESNLGYIKNFEKCLSLCTGELIAIADHDDIWKSHKIETLVHAIGDAMMVYSDSVHIDKEGKELGKKISDSFRLHDRPHPNAFIFYDFIWGHTTLLKKELLGFAMPVPPHMPYDTWLAYTAASLSHINYVDEPLTGWRQHEGSFTSVTYQANQQKKEQPERKMEEHREKLERISLLKENRYCRNKEFMEKLYTAYAGLRKGYSSKLFFLLAANQKTLFPVWRRNYLSKLNEFRKMARRVKST